MGIGRVWIVSHFILFLGVNGVELELEQPVKPPRSYRLGKPCSVPKYRFVHEACSKRLGGVEIVHLFSSR